MKTEAPLAARMRTLEEFIGQEDILGSDRILRRPIEEQGVCVKIPPLREKFPSP